MVEKFLYLSWVFKESSERDRDTAAGATRQAARSCGVIKIFNLIFLFYDLFSALAQVVTFVSFL